MQILGLPEEDARKLREWVTLVAGNDGSRERQERALKGWGQISGYLKEQIALRKALPMHGLINDIVHSSVEGRPLTDDEILSMCTVVVAGGLDTVVVVTSFIANHLANHAEDREYVRSQPEKLNEIVEEFMRRFSPSNLGREVRCDMVYRGLNFREGEQVLLPFPLAGLDDRIHENPLRIDFERKSSQHAGFGAGVHMCVGAALARREIRIFLEEWLTRVPDFHIKAGTKPNFGTAIVNSISDVMLAWS